MERTVNPELASFMSEVNAVVRTACGVSYAEIYRDVHDDVSAMRTHFESGGTADTFAELVIKQEGLALISSVGVDAREINLRRAALQAFSQEHSEWLLGGDGALYTADSEQQRFRILPVKAKNGNGWGFAAEEIVLGLPEVDDRGRVVLPSNAVTERLGAGIDISDAVQAYDNRLSQKAGLEIR